METSGTSARLIIVCGLPGSGKTTLARSLERRLPAVRFCPDEWMYALSLDVYDEERRGKIEALQWKIAQELLALGLMVIIEWAPGEDPSVTPCGLEREPLAPALRCIISTLLPMFFSRGFNAGLLRIHP